MPKFVDHDQRRAQVIEALLDLIAREGYAAGTSRSLARHLGVSNGTLWRYFRDKEELLASAYRAVVEQTDHRAAAASRELGGVAAVTALLGVLLPLDEVSKREAKVVVSSWGASVGAPPGVNGVARPELAAWHRRLEVLLEEALTRGELRDDTPITLVAIMLISYAVNAQLEYVFQGDEVTGTMASTVLGLLAAFAPHA